MIGILMMMLDAYIFSPALATIVKDFHTSYDLVAWISILYMLISTSVMPLAGKLWIYSAERGFSLLACYFLLSDLSWWPIPGTFIR